MAVVGQCKTDPVSGVAGVLWNALIGDGDNGLAAITLVSGSTMRKVVGSLYQAIATAIVNVVGSSTHTEGPAVTWATGTNPGQISFGAAAPNGTLTSASGCDEGGIVTFNVHTNTASGIVFTVHFAQAFSHAPAVSMFPANDAAAHLIFSAEMHATSTIDDFSFSTASGASPLTNNTTYAFYWVAKGAV